MNTKPSKFVLDGGSSSFYTDETHFWGGDGAENLWNLSIYRTLGFGQLEYSVIFDVDSLRETWKKETILGLGMRRQLWSLDGRRLDGGFKIFQGTGLRAWLAGVSFRKHSDSNWIYGASFFSMMGHPFFVRDFVRFPINLRLLLLNAVYHTDIKDFFDLRFQIGLIPFFQYTFDAIDAAMSSTSLSVLNAYATIEAVWKVSKKFAINWGGSLSFIEAPMVLFYGGYRLEIL